MDPAHVANAASHDAQLLRGIVEDILTSLVRARGLYPPAVFAPLQKYGTTIFRARHPDLAQYFSSASAHVCRQIVAQLESMHEPGPVCQIDLVVKEDIRPIEFFTLDVTSHEPLQSMPHLGITERIPSLGITETLPAGDLSAAVSAFLLKISNVDDMPPMLCGLSDDATFSVKMRFPVRRLSNGARSAIPQSQAETHDHHTVLPVDGNCDCDCPCLRLGLLHLALVDFQQT